MSMNTNAIAFWANSPWCLNSTLSAIPFSLFFLSRFIIGFSDCLSSGQGELCIYPHFQSDSLRMQHCLCSVYGLRCFVKGNEGEISNSWQLHIGRHLWWLYPTHSRVILPCQIITIPHLKEIFLTKQWLHKAQVVTAPVSSWVSESWSRWDHSFRPAARHLVLTFALSHTEKPDNLPGFCCPLSVRNINLAQFSLLKSVWL